MGDVIAQLVTREKDKDFDWKRLGRASIFGTFILGPLAHLHFGFLEWLIVKRVSCSVIIITSTRLLNFVARLSKL